MKIMRTSQSIKILPQVSSRVVSTLGKGENKETSKRMIGIIGNLSKQRKQDKTNTRLLPANAFVYHG